MPPPKPNPEFEALLDYLKHNRGCDLTGYKRSTLIRRFQHRMRQLNIEDYPSYLEYLQFHINEYRALLNEVLINVTGFFRDQAVWDYLAVSLIPQIIRQQPNQVIRVWSAGCAGGQEIYSLLILLAEALGIESCLQRVQCYATDADEAALQQARQGIYSNSEVSGIRPEWLEKYFQRTESNYIFHPQLRRTIIFGRHNLTQDAPISKLDLILCRNVLIYFNPHVQMSILVRFHFALKKTGFLVLGQSETFNHHRAIFTAVNLKHRVYTKGLGLDMQEHLFISPKTPQKVTVEPPSQSCFWQTAFETSPVAQLAVDVNGYLVSTNEQANRLFGLSFNDWQRPLQDLEVGKQLGFQILNQPFHRYHPVVLKSLEWSSLTTTKYFDVTIAPVYDAKQKLLGITLAFLEITEGKKLREKLELTNLESSTLKNTLQSLTSELTITQIELASVRQEIKLLEDTLNIDRSIDGSIDKSKTNTNSN